jgi:hypothetical protein
LDLIGQFVVDRHRETWFPGDPYIVNVLNIIYNEHTIGEATRLRRLFTKALVGGTLPYELSEWMPYLPRKALEDVINILRVQTRYKWNAVYTGQGANNTGSMDERG